MRNYLMLRAKAREFRSGPEVQAALTASRVAELSLPTLGPGETWRGVRGYTPHGRRPAARGLACEHLDQLTLEHLYGIR